MADITARDADGELIATPAEWDEESGEAPKIRVHLPRHARPSATAGVGDRALLRVERSDEGEGVTYRGRVIKIIDHSRNRVLGIFRVLPSGGGRLIPVDKKQAGRELNIAKPDTGGAEEEPLQMIDVFDFGALLALGSRRCVETKIAPVEVHGMASHATSQGCIDLSVLRDRRLLARLGGGEPDG